MMIRRRGITILSRNGRNVFPALVLQEVKLRWELGGHCTYEGYNLHQVPLVCMAVFRQVSLELGPSSLETEYSSDWASTALREICITVKADAKENEKQTFITFKKVSDLRRKILDFLKLNY